MSHSAQLQKRGESLGILITKLTLEVTGFSSESSTWKKKKRRTRVVCSKRKQIYKLECHKNEA